MSKRDRLMKIISELNITDVDFAKSIGYKRQIITQWKDGSTPISPKALCKIIEHYKQFNPRWIIIGEGEMYESKTRSNFNTSIHKIYNQQQVNEGEAEYISEIERLRKENDKLRNKYIGLLEKKLKDST